MRFPENTKVTCDEVCFDGLFKPRFFLAISAENDGICMTQYVLGHPLLLKFRLRRALGRCLKMLAKYKEFST
jgi:hypothetical protein